MAIAVALVVVLALGVLTAGGMAAYRAWNPWGDLLGGIPGIGVAGSAANAVGGSANAVGDTNPLSITPSATDYNGDGVDDTTEIVAGARKDAEAVPAYDDGYYAGGYPPADRGACTDLVWRAFREAGYDLKAMVDADVAANPKAYAAVAPKADPNIDFRRTGVLDVFFKRYGQSLSLDPADRGQWQPGDIVVFETTRHIAVVSDRASRATGTPYLLHNMGDDNRDNDYLDSPNRMAVTGHYRFDASKVLADALRAWK
ncbi:DUF1287 domain-containing protein [Bifidobacterium avesanii]|nr:DUF1287 domain-containing protein [Bifidobacterium avesanii]